MDQTEGRNKSEQSLQRQNNQQLAHENPPRNWIMRNWKTVASVSGLSVAAGTGVGLLSWASGAIDDIAVALNFFAQNTLSWLIFLAVIVQAVISSKQWRAMHDGLDRTDTVIEKMQLQLDTMQDTLEQTKRQADIAGDALRISTQAYVCIRNIELDPTKDRIFIEVENLGRVPADNITIDVWLRMETPPELNLKTPTHQERFIFGEKTALFSGNLPINVRIDHEKWLNSVEVGHVKSGLGLLIAEGLITFYDGFLPREPKETHFAFAYRLGDKRWYPQRILSPHELKEHKANQ